MGNRFLSSAGTGTNCALPIRVPNSSPVPDKNRAPIGPEILSSTGAGVWVEAPKAFPDSSSVLDNFQSAIMPLSHSRLSVPGEIGPPYCEIGVAIPLSQYAFQGIANHRCYTHFWRPNKATS